MGTSSASPNNFKNLSMSSSQSNAAIKNVGSTTTKTALLTTVHDSATNPVLDYGHLNDLSTMQEEFIKKMKAWASENELELGDSTEITLSFEQKQKKGAKVNDSAAVVNLASLEK